MKLLWLHKMMDSVADRGRELLGMAANDAPDLEQLCTQLLSQRGEAAGTALARELARAYEGMDEAQRDAFFELLADRFGPDPERILSAAERYRADTDRTAYRELLNAVESPRLELIRRLNTAPEGTRLLVTMRAHLLRRLRERPQLEPLDVDFQHLFQSWFNRGFLHLQRIDWHTPAAVLEKLVSYESVHQFDDWNELRRRLAVDRRCFAFFHSALPEEPLIFVQVALTRDLADSIMPLRDAEAPAADPADAEAAIFYSINNCQDGLRGISFGNFLLKQVTSELLKEFPKLRLFSTLSPMPGFARALADPKLFPPQRLQRLLAPHAAALRAASGAADAIAGLHQLLEAPETHQEVLAAPLRSLGLAYLACARRGERPHCPVAAFHLANGARIERLNPFANLHPYGLRASHGLMVNYRYKLDELEANHERFIHAGSIAVAPRLAREQRRLADAWPEPTGAAAI